MKTTLCLILTAVATVMVISCKKTNETPPVTRADYYQLKVGNYWVYRGYNLDSTGAVTDSNNYDSAYVEKDTLIRGLTYYKLFQDILAISHYQMPWYLRDSSGFLVDWTGRILASDCNFTDTLFLDTRDTLLYRGYGRMTGIDSLVTVPAGSFPSITYRLKVIPSPPNTAHLPARYSYDVYGKGVGRIKSHAFFFSGIGQIESRLIRYRVR